ncbi:hypothetical protein MRY87_03270 [bacterium]|nr:hypothetical protein [bacterium]
MDGSSGYQLIFNGPRDTSPETLRRIKGVFIAELDCSIEEVKKYLDDAPTVIFSTEEEEALKHMATVLESAGGIVSVAGLLQSQSGEKVEEEAEEDELEFTFDLEELTDSKTEKKSQAPKVYSLEFNPEDSPFAEEEESPLLDISEEGPVENDELAETITATGLSLAAEEEEGSPQEAEQLPTLEFDAPSSEVSQEASGTEKLLSEDSTEEPDTSDLDLTFDDDFEPETALQEKRSLDPQVAGELNDGEQWDLSLDEESERTQSEISPELENEEESASPEEVVEEQEAPSTEDDLLIFDLEEVEDREEVEAEAEEQPQSEILETLHELEEDVSAAASTLASFTSTVEVGEAEETRSPPPHTEEITQDAPKEAISPTSSRDEEEVSKDSKERKGIPLPAIASLVAILLLVGNIALFWSNFFAAPQAAIGITEDSLDSIIEATAKRASTERKAKQESTAPVMPLSKIAGDVKTPLGQIWFQFLARGDRIIKGDVTYTAPKPEPLSKLEFGLGTTARPWVHTAEMAGITFTQDELGQSVSSSPVRLFIEQGKDRFREVGHSRILLGYDSETNLIVGELIFGDSEESTPPQESTFSFTGNREEGFLLRGRIPFSTKSSAKVVE